MADDLRLSVVMATYNRAETIRETLRHLADQSLDPTQYEVIVIDDGSPDHTRVVVDEWMDRAPFKLTYLHHANRGPGYTENRGLEAARAPVVLLMADDIFMAHDTLAAHLAMHDAHPEPEVAVLGRVEQSPTLDGNLFLRTWDPFRFSAFAGQTELPYYRFWACNISVKRDFVMRYGPFREQRGRAGAAAHEDPELGYRLSRGGLRIVYGPAALGHHHHVVTFEQACKRRYMQGMNFGEFRRLTAVPEIPVAYHVLTWRTFPDHLRAWFGPRRRYLTGTDRNPAGLLLWHLARMCVFNGPATRMLWEPLLRQAEHRPALAKLVNRELYRGVLFHHFLSGCRDGDRRFDRAPGQALGAGSVVG
jgi:glycosyltransferase involved in cell wall biosynthesis